MTPRLPSAVVSDDRVGFRAAFRNSVFARLFVAEAQSVFGDQLARVALSILVFDATDSVAWTAAVYAVSFLPAIAGGLIVGGTIARWGERRTMVACDFVRSAAYASMAIPGVPLPVLFVVLGTAVFLGPVFSSAEVNLLAIVLPHETFRTATGARMLAHQVAQVGGFVAGGLIVAAVSPAGALLVNAATFLGSALLLVTLPRRRVRRDHSAEPSRLGGRRALARVPELKRLLLLSALGGVFVVPEGLAVPFGAVLGAGPVEVGLLLAALPAGATIGVLVMVRWVAVRRRRLAMAVMAIACGVPLVVSSFVDSWAAALACWLVAGFFSAYQVEALTEMVRIVPDELRAGLIGLGTAVLIASQGLGILTFGVIAAASSVPAAVALAGGFGVVAATLIMVWRGRRGPRKLRDRNVVAHLA